MERGYEFRHQLPSVTVSVTIGTGYSGAGYQNLSIGVADGSSQFAGSITNTDNNAAWIGNLVKEGTGTIVLSGNSGYIGTPVTSGTTSALCTGVLTNEITTP